MKHEYSKQFYTRRADRAARSAQALVPLIVDLIGPSSVVDIGCGDGIWLNGFRAEGVETAIGLDGPWVPAKSLRIDEASFVRFDLGSAPLPFRPPLPQARFDLAMSLEVAEHLDETRADAFADLMASLSDMLLISAAAPHQGGTGHVNERWPDYWAEKFRVRGYRPFDFLRYALWTDERIAPWYRQNLIGYFRGEIPEAVQRFGEASLRGLLERPLPLSHPGVHAYKLGKLRGWLTRPIATGLAEYRRRRG